MTTIEMKNNIIHQLIIDLAFNNITLPEKLQSCIQKVQFSTGETRSLLIQQAIGYIVAMKDFNLLNTIVCDAIIDRLHTAR